MRRIMVILVTVAGCNSGSVPNAKDQGAVLSDQEKLARCVAEAKTPAESDGCAAKVRAERPIDVYREAGGG